MRVGEDMARVAQDNARAVGQVMEVELLARPAVRAPRLRALRRSRLARMAGPIAIG